MWIVVLWWFYLVVAFRLVAYDYLIVGLLTELVVVSSGLYLLLLLLFVLLGY